MRGAYSLLWTWRAPLAWTALLLVTVFGLSELDAVFRIIQPDIAVVIYQRDSFANLLLNHLLIVGAAALVSVSAGLIAGIVVTRAWGRDFLPLVAQVAAIGQTVPPVAVLALSVPLLGFGSLPTIVALVLYGLLPVLRNTLAGLQGVPLAVVEAARGMGMSPRKVLLEVELPLAAVVILAGVRTTVTVTIATAAIGSTIGASTLGDPVIAGLVNGNTAYVLQGALLIGLLAVSIDSGFERLEQVISAHQGR